MHDHFGVGRGAEDRPLLLQNLANLHRVNDVAIMGNRQRPTCITDDHRLGIA